MSEAMNPLPDLSPDDREFAGALASLAPAPSGVDRDAMMFSAGRASAPRANSRPWQLAALIALLAIGGMWALRPTRTVTVERTLVVRTAEPAPIVLPPSPMPSLPVLNNAAGVAGSEVDPLPYLRLRRAVLARGLDALPTPTVSPSASPTPPALGGEALECLPLWQRRTLLGQGGPS